MNSTISITSNWQIHIPKSVREKLGITTATQASLTLRGDEIIIKPKKSKFLSSAGVLNKDFQKNNIDINRIRDQIDYSKL